MFTSEELEELAVAAIKSYLNVSRNPKFTDERIKKEYKIAIKLMVENALNVQNNELRNVKQFTQGSQSVVFESGCNLVQITKEIKDVLPKPFVFGS